MKLVLLAALTLMLTGCAALVETETLISAAVTDYCKAPEFARTTLREKVAKTLEPNSIEIHCSK
jgi:hypothetical protein